MNLKKESFLLEICNNTNVSCKNIGNVWTYNTDGTIEFLGKYQYIPETKQIVFAPNSNYCELQLGSIQHEALPCEINYKTAASCNELLSLKMIKCL